MRRKSERNKSKGSPEKKAEKATRKSSRRRARKSPSSSPEREVASEAAASEAPSLVAASEGSSAAQPERAAALSVAGAPAEEADQSNLSPEDDNGSVWKVARADASPGEIQKLKLCRQRNISEASSDNSVERKSRSNKWQESGEGVTEEDDSADERPRESDPAAAQPDDSCSRRPGQGLPDAEVSDSKEETPAAPAPADLSDGMPHADREDEEERVDAERAGESTLSLDCSMMMETTQGNGQEDEATPGDVAEVAPPQEEEEEREEEEEEEKEEEARNDGEDKAESSADEKARQSDSSSNGEERGRTKVRSSVTMTRRKHRDKYHDSSNSESNESEDEQEDGKKSEDERKPSPRKGEEEGCNDRVKEGEGEEDADGEKGKERVRQQEGQGEAKEAAGERAAKKEEKAALGKSAPVAVQKPTKVNLKRSFTRMVDPGLKKDEKDKVVDGETAENKENCAIETKSVPKRRRWGTTITSDITPAFTVSTDSLKALVPEAKPLSLNEVRLSKDDDMDGRKSRDRKHSLNNSVENQKNRDDSGRKSDSIDNHHTGKRKILIVKDSHISSPSPPSVKPTNILLIKNLVRPFTLNQIKELLSRTGKIVDNGFWMDRIKSKCFVEYSNEDQAFETRQALHGISWPLSNPKKLQVEYATKADMQLARESSKDLPVTRKAEAITSSDPWTSWNQEEKSNSTKVMVVREWDLGKEDGQVHLKDKEREKKDEKKRRQRSASPHVEVHLPPSARKFKKKEDEPPPAKLLDDLFRKTKATPCIYWLPLTSEQIAVKKEMRRQHMAEHARRLEEMRRMDRNRDRDRDRDRRRRSPRK